MASRNLKLTIEYEGSAYAGWQFQPEQKTVQGTIVDAIEQVTQQRVNLVGAGRTDAGVHALGQVANFRVDHQLETDRFANAINYYLPDDIRIHKSEQVDHDFHSTCDATFRQYRYLVAHDRSAIYRGLRWECGLKLDLDDLNQVASEIVGEHNFASFCVTSSLKEDNRCRIASSQWSRSGELYIYEIRGNRFLHNMVRGLVGSMVNIVGKPADKNPLNLTFERFRDIISLSVDSAIDPERVGFTAPAHGLYMVAVGY